MKKREQGEQALQIEQGAIASPSFYIAPGKRSANGVVKNKKQEEEAFQILQAWVPPQVFRTRYRSIRSVRSVRGVRIVFAKDEKASQVSFLQYLCMLSREVHQKHTSKLVCQKFQLRRTDLAAPNRQFAAQKKKFFNGLNRGRNRRSRLVNECTWKIVMHRQDQADKDQCRARR